MNDDASSTMRAAIIAFGMWLIFCTGSAAASGAGIGIVKISRGPVSIERQDKTIAAKVGDRLFEKDIIVTGPGGSIGAILKDDSLLSLGSNSRLVISEFIFQPAEKKLSGILQVKRGTMTYLAGLMAKMKGDAMRFETPVAVCGIRGTHIAIKVDD